MPTADTRHFGPLHYEDSSVLIFPVGLPGFDPETRFALVEQPELAPLVYLQSLQSPELCFLAVPAHAIEAGYSVRISAEDLERLDLDSSRQPDPGREVLCLALLCAPENGPVTANLLAPIVVNLASGVAVQAVRADSRYSHQHPIHAEPVCS